MKTIIKEIKLYEFKELRKEVQNKIINDYFQDYGINENVDIFEDDIKEILNLLGYKDFKISYSLSYSQGDGLSFKYELNADELIKMLQDFKDNKVNEEGYRLLESIVNEVHELVKDFSIDTSIIKDEDIFFSNQRTNSNYYHLNTTSLSVEYNSMYIDIDEENENTNKVEEYINKLHTLLNQIYQIVCRHLEKMGYDTIYYIPTIEEFIDMSDGMYFLENGNKYS